ncbi:hypothetical protein CBR_g31045 [Chara braunii]|uniref:DUF659 domain-containing protein n=1 Tax=Chara braunii TaxID=69332 RepID=A0A388LE54_CHABU|nr:hypothetical protein CBR_g31045 [Chara braunii]|eukprot:GBG80585.1 hypothetical protein CBR_g31045 [Chara braunii]
MNIKLIDITAFVTDSAGVNVTAMEVFQKDESVKHIFWIPCVAHIMDLILEDIGGIDWAASRIAQARLVTRFFKRHGYAIEVLKAYSTKTLLTPAETPWWVDLRALCKMLEPIMDMLKLVDNDTRQINKILRRFEEMIASCLSAFRDIDWDQQDAIVEVFLRRRTMFKTPAHTATMLLDPEFRDATLYDDAEVQQALVEALVQILDRPSLCDDGDGERPDIFGKWVHYWQAVEDEAVVDQQLARGTGALAKVTEEELSLARERMRVVSRMGAERRVAESDRRRCRAGGRGRGGHGRAGVGGQTRGNVGSTPRTWRQRTDGCIRRARMRWDEGDFLFDNTSSDDGDFFAHRVHIATDTGAHVMPQDLVAMSEDEMGDPSNKMRRDPVHAEAQVSVTDTMVTEENTGFRITHPQLPAPVVSTEEETEFGGPGPLHQAQTCLLDEMTLVVRGFDEFGGDTILHPPEYGAPAIFHVSGPWAVEQGLTEKVARNRRSGLPVAAQRSLGGSLEAASGDFVAQGGHGLQQLSDDVSSVRPPDEGPQREPHRGSTETLEARPPGVIRSDGGEGVGHDTAQPGSADARRSIGGGIEHIGSSTSHPNIVRPSAHDVGDAVDW